MDNKINPIILNSLFIYSFLYNPDLPNAKHGIKCFIMSISELISNTFFTNYIDNNEIPVSSRNALFNWSYQLGKSTGFITTDYSSFYKYYDNLEKSKTTWSHPTWILIHYLPYINANKWTSDTKLSYKAFIACLQFLLPCEICRNHLNENLKHENIDKFMKLGNLFEWSVNLHNTVNKMLNKPIIDVNTAIILLKQQI